MKAPTLPPLTGLPRETRPVRHPGDLCHDAMGRLLAVPDEPLLFADWDRMLMIHYEIDPEVLRPHVPFPLDLHGGKAYVTLAAFTLRHMRPRRGGRLGRWLFKPIATHGFLNVRTYVRVNGEPGIYFLAEYVNNLLSLKLGRPAFGLPYRFARLDYRHEWENGRLAGTARPLAGKARLAYTVTLPAGARFTPAATGTRAEWLMERYTAYTVRRGKRLLFRVWHPPWAERPIEATITDDTLIRRDFPWFRHARHAGANFSPGVFDVWMGRPHPVADAAA